MNDSTNQPKPRRRRWPWIIGLLALVGLVVGVGIPYVYIHFINKPAKRLSFAERDKQLASQSGTVTTTATKLTPASDGVTGSWKVVAPSTAGYRVKEVIAGQKAEGVGRTDKVDGSVVIDGTRVTKAELSVDLASVKSDQARRDEQFHGRIMSTDEFPVAIFTLDEPIDLATVPGDGVAVHASAKGTLSMHGVDKQMTIPVQARRAGANIEINGSVELVFKDFGIDSPSIGPVTTEDHGLLEFLVTLSRS